MEIERPRTSMAQRGGVWLYVSNAQGLGEVELTGMAGTIAPGLDGGGSAESIASADATSGGRRRPRETTREGGERYQAAKLRGKSCSISLFT